MISTKGRYALRAMLDIAEHNVDGFIPLKDIAERQEISIKYLEIIMRDLVRGKFVTAARGKGGGYQLTRETADYSVGEILEFMEGSLATVACLEKDAAPCPNASACKTLPLWAELDTMIYEFLNQKSLADLTEK